MTISKILEDKIEKQISNICKNCCIKKRHTCISDKRHCQLYKLKVEGYRKKIMGTEMTIYIYDLIEVQI